MNYIILLIILLICMFCLLLIVNKFKFKFEKLETSSNKKTQKFKNVLLLVVFNYADCVKNKNFIKKIYEKHFKKMIFYSDIPENNTIETDPEVNYISITRGYYTQNIFKEFYNKYKTLIDDSDGIMYTMDDNIINVNELDNYPTDKIIYPFKKDVYYTITDEPNKLTKDWGRWDINSMKKIIDSEENKLFNVERFTWAWSDWFYLPKKYINDKIFDLFEFFGKKEIFLEIAIPTIIRYFNQDCSDYIEPKNIYLWGDRHIVEDKDNVYKLFKEDKYLMVHPIKFNSNPNSLIWLDDILNN